MLSLSGCKCRRDAAPGCSDIIMPDAQCRSAYNNGNERRNTVHANAKTNPRVVRYLRYVRHQADSLDLEAK